MINISDCEQKTDSQLVALTLKNQEYYYCLMKRYESALMNYIYRLSGMNRTDIQDILQEVFILAYQNLNDYNEDFKFSSWIYRIAHNYTISTIRKKPRYYQNISWDEHDLDQLVQSDFNLEKNFLQKIDYENLLCIIDLLPLKYKEVLLLKFLEGKDYQEISDIVRKPIGTVGTLINRAKKLLLKEIEKYKAGIKYG
ncbi:MAG: sigma-70 family RNA polymerase sigma factor [Atribacterota bacterium]|nr:sigma-70 family RNA polymerase sigma factor [Atribacterota bacterium]MDD4895364.1 sigma-70 family RNA polymerase sigma factor [Atribacterota bacterium]MDD5637114.1 sigma-70 family RNA polymerase sigma factor [Atribacterota bacterium]